MDLLTPSLERMNKQDFKEIWQQNIHYMDVISTMIKDVTAPKFIDKDRLEALYLVTDETKEWQMAIAEQLDES